MMMMGAGYGGTLGWLGIGLGMVLHLAVVVAAILAVIWLFKAVFPGAMYSGQLARALELAKERYAKGEITAEEYRQIKQDLQ